MRKTRFTERQIIVVLKSVKAGWTVKDVCREAGSLESDSNAFTDRELRLLRSGRCGVRFRWLFPSTTLRAA